jgi:hypothetical protein
MYGISSSSDRIVLVASQSVNCVEVCIEKLGEVSCMYVKVKILTLISWIDR